MLPPLLEGIGLKASGFAGFPAEHLPAIWQNREVGSIEGRRAVLHPFEQHGTQARTYSRENNRKLQGLCLMLHCELPPFLALLEAAYDFALDMKIFNISPTLRFSQ